MSTTDSPAGAVGAPRPVHSAQTPAIDPVPDLGTAKLLEEQVAARTVGAGAIDDVAVRAGEVPLLHDGVVDADAAVQCSAARQRRSEAERVGESLVQDAKDGALTEAEGAARGSRAETRLRVRQAKGSAAEAEAEAARLALVLRGEQRDVDGGLWPGAPIAAGTPAEARRAQRRRRSVVLLLAAGLFTLEGTVTAGSLYSFLRSSDWLQAAMIAVTALVSLTLGPVLLGQSLARWRAGARSGAAAAVAVVPVALIWLTVGFTLAWVRVTSEQQAYAAQQAARAQVLGGGGVIGEAPVLQAAAGYRIDAPLAITFWTAVLLGLGIVVGTYEMVTFNPARPRELEARVAVWTWRDRLVEQRGRLDRIRRQVQYQRLDVRLTDRMWREEEAAVLARAALRKQLYSEGVVLAHGTPEMAEAMEDRIDRTRAFGHRPTAEVRAPHALVPIPDAGRSAGQKDAS